MIALLLKQRIRKLFNANVKRTEIKKQLGIDGFTYREATKAWGKEKQKRKKHFSKISKQQSGDKPMGQSYQDQQKKMQLTGYKRLRIAQRCKQCRNLSYIMRADGSMCFHCGERQNSVIKRVLAGVAGLMLLMFAGCATPPKEANVVVKVCGQEVVMNFKK